MVEKYNYKINVVCEVLKYTGHNIEEIKSFVSDKGVGKDEVDVIVDENNNIVLINSEGEKSILGIDEYVVHDEINDCRFICDQDWINDYLIPLSNIDNKE